MTQEEAKHFSDYVSGGGSKEGQADSKLKRDMKNVLSFTFGRHGRKKVSDVKEESLNGKLASQLNTWIIEPLRGKANHLISD